VGQDDSIHAQNAPPNRAEMGEESAKSKGKPPTCTTFVDQVVPGLLTTLLSSGNTPGIDYGDERARALSLSLYREREREREPWPKFRIQQRGVALIVGDRDICPGVLEHRGQHEESGPARQHQRGVATGTSLIAVEDAGFAWIPTLPSPVEAEEDTSREFKDEHE